MDFRERLRRRLSQIEEAKARGEKAKRAERLVIEAEVAERKKKNRKINAENNLVLKALRAQQILSAINEEVFAGKGQVISEESHPRFHGHTVPYTLYEEGIPSSSGEDYKSGGSRIAFAALILEKDVSYQGAGNAFLMIAVESRHSEHQQISIFSNTILDYPFNCERCESERRSHRSDYKERDAVIPIDKDNLFPKQLHLPSPGLEDLLAPNEYYLDTLKKLTEKEALDVFSRRYKYFSRIGWFRELNQNND